MFSPARRRQRVSWSTFQFGCLTRYTQVFYRGGSSSTEGHLTSDKLDENEKEKLFEIIRRRAAVWAKVEAYEEVRQLAEKEQNTRLSTEMITRGIGESLNDIAAQVDGLRLMKCYETAAYFDKKYVDLQRSFESLRTQPLEVLAKNVPDLLDRVIVVFRELHLVYMATDEFGKSLTSKENGGE
jgi:hypothetical protein